MKMNVENGEFRPNAFFFPQSSGPQQRSSLLLPFPLYTVHQKRKKKHFKNPFFPLPPPPVCIRNRAVIGSAKSAPVSLRLALLLFPRKENGTKKGGEFLFCEKSKFSP